MKRISIKFRHNGKVVTLRALIKFDGSGHLIPTKHRCNYKVSMYVIDCCVFFDFFALPGPYYYSVCGSFDKNNLSISYICPYNKATGLYEKIIPAKLAISEGIC